ncbi:hypothetical protein GBM03_21930 [Yersinia pseudotuberculosis]|nr:hypothetical protein [Yersinia pseudotuberculosis]MBO1572668.1 hypothetical protein [Yersinia pseudotuberculosis]MBO1587555.1 hypothetical protein [Yersinia pseudotuberculosis]MBO1637091.1 hypothetical protein [Yersinia pseudotuberculosis]
MNRGLSCIEIAYATIPSPPPESSSRKPYIGLIAQVYDASADLRTYQYLGMYIGLNLCATEVIFEITKIL